MKFSSLVGTAAEQTAKISLSLMESVFCLKNKQELVLIVACGDLNTVFTKHGDFLVLFVQFIRFGEML